MLKQEDKLPNRFKSALRVLKGEQTVAPDSTREFAIAAEWAKYQVIFQGQLEQMSAYLARAAKAEKSRLRAMADELGQPIQGSKPVSGDHESRKAALRSRVSAIRLTPPGPVGNAPSPPTQKDTG